MIGKQSAGFIQQVGHCPVVPLKVKLDQLDIAKAILDLGPSFSADDRDPATQGLLGLLEAAELSVNATEVVPAVDSSRVGLERPKKQR